MALTAAEQYLIELINRARLDPAAEAKRYGVSLNQGLGNGTIDTKAKQVLAPNSDLEAAATSHSNWMLNKDVFSHTGAGGSNAGGRMEDAGYTFAGTYSWRENLAWTGTTGDVSMTRAIREHHEGLYRSAGHRENTFADGVREIGVGQVEGKFTYQGTQFNASMLTEKFAASGNAVFVTGVAYRDNDNDKFYSIGEGRSDYWFKGGGDTDKTADAGGYALKVNSADDVTVTIGKGDQTLAKLDVDTSDGNAKLDLVIGKNGNEMLYLSGSADLESGIRDARLLGVADLDLTGSDKGNELIGNSGRNDLSGEEGRDKLKGGGGNDKLSGGAGSDRLLGNKGSDALYGGGGKDKLFGNKGKDYLDGGAGRDVMTGGKGADEFVFSAGSDTIRDFQNNVDKVLIDNALARGKSDALDHGKIVKGDAVFDFGGGDVLTIRDVDNLDILANDLIIV